MDNIIGIRREDKNQWERRVSLTPDDVALLSREHGVRFLVQPSPIRIFPDSLYEEAGASVTENLDPCDIIMGVKEMPEEVFKPEKTYIFFSHTIKGQEYNMDMLRRLAELNCSLIDYEKIEDEAKQRLVFFGIHAGYAGMIDGLWMLGQRLMTEGYSTPLQQIRQAIDYESLEEAKLAIASVGREIADQGLPGDLHPIVIGFAGYGHVSKGAQSIFDVLPHTVLDPTDLVGLDDRKTAGSSPFCKVVFKEEHLVEPLNPDQPFLLQDYYDNPGKYRGIFHRYLPHLTLLVNAIFWTPDYPRLITRKEIQNLYRSGQPRFRGVSDISCDPEGSIECTLHCTDPGNPVYVYLTEEDRAEEGFMGNGPVILAVDNLPSELANEASTYFSKVLKEFIPKLASCDFSVDTESLQLPDPLKRALILHHGRFTPEYEYMKNFIS